MSETTLLGVVISQDLRWAKNTEFICQKARQKLWILRRMLNFQLNIHQLFDVYIKEVRSLLELAVPVWHSGLTKQQSNDIERVQKLAFRIILGDNYANYETACDILYADTLETRRIKLCSKFAAKNLKSEHPMFQKVGTHANTRQKSDLVKEYRCNFGRYQKSSIPFLAKLLNTNHRKK